MIKYKNNVQIKLDELSKYQIAINKKLDELENNDSSFTTNYTNDKEKLKKDLEAILTSKGNNYNHAPIQQKSYKKNSPKKQNKTPKQLPVSKKESPKKQNEKMIKYIVNEKYVQTHDKEKLNLFNLNLKEFHKRQNLYLTNEMVGLRIKLNKIKNKNQLLNNLLSTNASIKNSHVMEKLISNFIEELAVNWNEIVEMLIDELITEEVFNLNEIELTKSKYNEVDIEEFTKEMNRIENDSQIFDCHKFELDIYEINRIIGDYNQKEIDFMEKYK